jgi:hypothetical protein
MSYARQSIRIEPRSTSHCGTHDMTYQSQRNRRRTTCRSQPRRLAAPPPRVNRPPAGNVPSADLRWPPASCWRLSLWRLPGAGTRPLAGAACRPNAIPTGQCQARRINPRVDAGRPAHPVRSQPVQPAAQRACRRNDAARQDLRGAFPARVSARFRGVAGHGPLQQPERGAQPVIHARIQGEGRGRCKEAGS